MDQTDVFKDQLTAVQRKVLEFIRENPQHNGSNATKFVVSYWRKVDNVLTLTEALEFGTPIETLTRVRRYLWNKGFIIKPNKKISAAKAEAYRQHFTQ